MNNTICFSIKTANKHVNAIRRMFDANGIAYLTKLNSNLTPTSRAVRKTILTYMLEDNVINKVDNAKVKFNVVVDDPLLKEWTALMHQHHINRKGLIKAAKKAKECAPTPVKVPEIKHIEVKVHPPALAFSNSPEVAKAFQKIDKPQAAKHIEHKPVEQYADQPGTLNNKIKQANASVDKDGEHSIQKACDKINEKPVHENVEDLVFLTRQEATDITEAMHSLVYQVNFSIYGSRDPMHCVRTEHTAAGRLADLVLRPFKVKA